MAIEFHCPYCTAAIRVPDSAAGRRGTCPSCATSLIVPEPDRPHDVDAPLPPLDADPPSVLAPPLSEKDETAAVPLVEPVDLATTSIARRLRRRRTGLNWFAPMLLGVALGGGVLWFFWQTQPQLSGRLSAVRVPLETLPPETVDRHLIEMPPEAVTAVLEDLAKTPQRLVSPLMEIEFTGTRRGLRVDLARGAQTRFYRVDFRGAQELREYYRTHARVLGQPRLDELQESVTRLAREWQTSIETTGEKPKLNEYRDSVGLNALVAGLGYHLEAIHENIRYRCVFEDPEGFLYFLLPEGTVRLEIRGRELSDGSTRFPGEYVVFVKAAAAD